MESSRVFVRGLPPDATPADLKRHFSKISLVTDVKCIPQRRIGYVGYKSPADAADAIKYYNKSFIRMSRIYVEPARPVEDQSGLKTDAKDANIKSDTEAAAIDANTEAAQNIKKRKRDDGTAKLQEFLNVMEPPSKVKAWANRELSDVQAIHPEGTTKPDTASKDVLSDNGLTSKSQEREPRPKPKLFNETTQTAKTVASNIEGGSNDPPSLPQSTDIPEVAGAPVASDEDWLRSRTSRLLGLLDDDESLMPRAPIVEHGTVAAESESNQPSPSGEIADVATQLELEPVQEADQKMNTLSADCGEADIGSGRLFVRNLAYATTEEDLRNIFESSDFGPVEEIHVPINHRSGTNKGYAYVQYKDAQAAKNALHSMDGTPFQGRLLHILPAALKRQTGLDEFAISKLPLKEQQQIKRKTVASSSTFNWNAMFMNADAVISSISERLGVPKSELLDPTSSDAAVKQAHAETHVIQETKAYFTANGVDLAAFKQKARGDTAVLVKNFSFETKATDLKTLFEAYGPVSRLLMPPLGTIAIVEFKHADDARSAFAGLAYRKVKDSILFLEKAPRDIFNSARLLADNGKADKPSVSDKLDNDEPQDHAQSSTLFVSNLNFATTTERLRELFEPLNGFLSAKVKQKPNPKKAGQFLSMGFGFVEFRTKEQAQAALTALDNHNLDGHKLLIKSSHKVIDAAEERKNKDTAKKLAGKKTKIIIKNLPFEASRKDVRSLLGPYGQLRSVRVPKKFDTSTRGFAFAEFVSAKEAENALDALKDTHLLGRRLVLEFAAEEAIDPEVEIAKMQKKVGKQADKVALQRLTGTGRKKFNIELEDGDHSVSNPATYWKVATIPDSIFAMDSRMHILSTPDQAYSAEGESTWGSSSRVLQDSSGNIGLEAASDFLKLEEDVGRDTPEAPSIFEPRHKSRCKGRKRPAACRSHRHRRCPWELDANFIRYEHRSERYRLYREKAAQSNEQKWPENVEVCLQYGLRIIPCLGRKKEIRENYNGAQGGRNELIQDYILKWTGQFRTRKQVSSHLQVLKAYLFDNPEWMVFVTKVDENQVVYRPSFLASVHDMEAGGKYGYRYNSYSTALPPPTGILGSNVPSVHQIGFEMFVENESGERHHTYSRIQSEIGSSHRSLAEVAGWQELYPRLASYFRQGHADSELILLETSFSLLQEYPPRGSILGVKPFVLVAGGTKYSNWCSCTQMYERGIQVTEKRRNAQLDNGLLDLEATNVGLTTFTKVTPRINCNWWAANVFGHILEDVREARRQGDEHAIKQAEERGRLLLEEVSMMQEIWATPGIDGNSPRRITILLWKFRQTRDNEAATTTWRRLTPPFPRDEIYSSAQSPEPLVLEPLITIDNSLPDTAMVEQASLYADQSRKNSLFVDDPESIITGQPSDMDSTLSTPTPDLRSLPSSTATSFASSTSGSMHPSNSMQESSFSSQDSIAYSYDGDLHSQDANYSARGSQYPQNSEPIATDLGYLAQEPYYTDPSRTYLGQGCGPGEGDDEYMQHQAPSIPVRQRSDYYTEPHDSQHLRATDVTQSFARRLSYHSQNDHHHEDPPAFAHTPPQDFTGGQIHISFADELQQQHHDYDHNPLAPSAHMLSHHDSFDSQYEEPYQEVYEHDRQTMEIGCHDELQHHHHHHHHQHHHHEPSLSIQDHQSLDPEFSAEPPFNPSPPVHHSSTTSLILHHPQPQPSLQHHIDSIRWTTHALWTAPEPHSQNPSEDHDLADETLKLESTHVQILEEVPDVEGLDDELLRQREQEEEQGRILGEVSERLERELEHERECEMERLRERELELELERELGRGMEMEMECGG